jgi:hypothetical protein
LGPQIANPQSVTFVESPQILQIICDCEKKG